jgi:hypothetical protein
MHASGIELGFVVRNVVIHMVQRLFQALGLKRDDFVAAGIFYGMQAYIHS